jgi:hypothetical protein
MNIVKVLKAVKHFKSILQCQNLVLTGSFVLKTHGLIEAEPKDIDILVVNPTDFCKEQIKSLQETSPAETQAKGSSSHHLLGITIFDGIKIDFFEAQGELVTLDYCGTETTTIKHIIDAKLAIGRDKDIIQLLKMSQNIMTQDKAIKLLENKY